MSEWQPIETAPKYCSILVWGQPTDVEGVKFVTPGVHSAYWDDIDEAWCLKGATWQGPFIKPEYWMDEPLPPEGRIDRGKR